MNNVNVMIKVDGLGEQSVNMPFSMATEVFLYTSRFIANRLRKSNKSINKAAPIENESIEKIPLPKNISIEEEKEENNSIAENYNYNKSVYLHPGGDIIEHYEKKIEEELINTNNPFTHEMFQNKKLVAYKCPECGKVTVRFLVLGESNIAHCHWCKEEVSIEKVVLANIVCPNCMKHTFIYLADGTDTVDCKECGSPIDIIYYQDGNKMKAKSANLLDKK